MVVAIKRVNNNTPFEVKDEFESSPMVTLHNTKKQLWTYTYTCLLLISMMVDFSFWK